MKTVFDIDLFLATPLIGILRREDEFDYAGMVGALIDGGLGTVEISFTHPKAPRQLAGMVSAAQGRLNIGAGTVTTLKRLAAARTAGATFVVAPALDPEVAGAAIGAKLPFFPGAALDVFAHEPTVPEALRTMENVVLTPHLGGGSREGRHEAQEQCVENVLRVLRGERPIAECIVLEPEAPARN